MLPSRILVQTKKAESVPVPNPPIQPGHRQDPRHAGALKDTERALGDTEQAPDLQGGHRGVSELPSPWASCEHFGAENSGEEKMQVHRRALLALHVTGLDSIPSTL